MSRLAASFWRILSKDPAVPILLSLFYIVAALLTLMMDGPPKGLPIAMMSAIPAAGFLALLTDRIGRYSNSAAILGIPDHRRTIRGIQILALGLFVLAPGVVAWRLGSGALPTLGILSAGVVVGLVMAMYRAILFWLVVLAYVAKMLLGPLDRLVTSPVTPVVLAVAAGVLLWRWFLFPARVEQAAGMVVAPLADSSHEVTDESLAETFGAKPEAIQAYEAMSDKLVAAATGGLVSGRFRPATIALGLGYSVAVNTKAIVWGVGIGLAALVAWRQFGSPEFGGAAYLAASGWTCMAIFTRVEGMLNAFCRHSTEEGVLLLSPFWPEPASVRRVIVLSPLYLCRGSVAGWAVVSTIGWVVGLVSTNRLRTGVVIVGSALLVATAAFVMTLARREVRRWRVATIVMGLAAVAGSLMVIFGTPESVNFLPVGLCLIVLPPLLGLTWFWAGPLRFPVNAPKW